MTRDVTPQVLNALDEPVVRPFFAVDIDFDSQPLYVWNAPFNGTINGKLYLGAGQLLSISSIEETTEMEARGASITMTGIPSSFLSLALQEPYQGRECRIYFGIVGEALSSYTEIFTGELDQMNIVEASDTATIQVTAENVLIRLERPVVRRFTDQDQKSRYPGDRGLEFVAGLQDKEIFWGRTAKT